MALTSHTFTLSLGGHRLQARAVCPVGQTLSGGRPTLVLLHAALGCTERWLDLPETLVAAGDCPALAYDRYGHGGSEPLSAPRGLEHLTEEACVTLPALLEACAIERPLLFGHGDGATIALLYAAAFPTNVAGVIAAAPKVFIEAATLRGVRAAQEQYRSGPLREQLERYHGAGSAALFASWSESWLAPASRDWNVEAELAAIRCPLLLLQGQEDPYGTPRQVQAIDHRVGGPCKVRLLPDCGHSPHHQARPQVLAALFEFMQNLTGPAAFAGIGSAAVASSDACGRG